jgi:hypothetical protein
VTPEAFLRRLRELVPGRPAEQGAELATRIEEWARQRRYDLLHDLARTICEEAGRTIHEWEASLRVRQIEACLASREDRAAIDVLLQISGSPADRSGYTRETLAAMVGKAQPDETLAALAQDALDGRELDFFAWMLHEAVLRGRDLRRHRAVVAFEARMREARHPLGALPMHALGLEEAIVDVLRDDEDEPPREGLSDFTDFSPVEPGPRGIAGVPLRRGSIVAHLRDEDFGVTRWSGDGARFRLSPPLVGGAPGAALLCGLGLTCLEGASEETVRIRAVEPSTVLLLLFEAARHGRFASARARGRAWAALGAMRDDAAKTLDAAAAGTWAMAVRWVLFAGESRWFHGDGWDFGIAGVEPGGQSLLVQAGTDLTVG